MPLISKATHQRLTASAILEQEVIFLRSRETAPEALLSHLAGCLTAKWETKPDGSRQLIIDTSAQAKKAKEKQAADRQFVVSSFSYLTKRLAAQPALLDAQFIRGYRERKARDDARRKAAQEAEDWAQMYVSADVMEETPSWRATSRLISLIGPDRLLQLPNDAKEVWAEQPTSVQQPFASGARQILANYRRELALLDQEAQVARILLVVKRWETTPSYSVYLKAYDGTGKMVDQGFVRLNNDAEAMKVPYTQRNPLESAPNGKAIMVPEEALEARTILQADKKEEAKSVLMPKWRPRLLDPITVEPTQWYQELDLYTAAGDLGRNIVGVTTEYLGARYSEDAKLTPSQLIAKLGRSITTTPDKWLIYVPAAMTDRIARDKAAGFLRGCEGAGGVSVDAAASWTAGSPSRYPSVTWVGDYLGSLLPGVGRYSAISTMLDEISLRFWAAMGPGVVSQLKQGSTLSLSSLNPKAKTLVQQMVYWFDLVESEKEPTDQFPTGIDNGTISMTVTERPILMAWNAERGKPADLVATDAEAFGAALVRGDRWRQVPAEVIASYDRFLIGTNRTYQIQIRLNPGNVLMELSLGESFFSPKQAPVSKLPSHMSQAVEKARAAAAAKPATPPPTNGTPPPL